MFEFSKKSLELQEKLKSFMADLSNPQMLNFYQKYQELTVFS